MQLPLSHLKRIVSECSKLLTTSSKLSFFGLYADVTLNLNDRTDRRDHKRDDCTRHIHSQFSHPPNITKPIPNAIEQLLSKLYSLETICKESPIFYEKIWNESGYNAKLKYTLLISDKINKKTQNSKLSGSASHLATIYIQILASCS